MCASFFVLTNLIHLCPFCPPPRFPFVVIFLGGFHETVPLHQYLIEKNSMRSLNTLE